MAAATLEFAERSRSPRPGVAVGACSPVAERLPALEAALVGASRDRPGRPGRCRASGAARADRRRARQRGLSAATRSSPCCAACWRASPDDGRLHPERQAGRLGWSAGHAARRGAARRSRAHRHQGRLRRRRLRRLHRAARRRQVCACLVALGQVAGRTVETVEGLGDGNGTLAALQTVVSRPWRGAVRHLHARHADGGPGAAGAGRRGRRAARSRMRWAACCAAAPATARSSMRSWMRRHRCPRAPPAGGAVGARLARVDGVGQAYRPRDVRRRRRSRRCAVAPRRPLAACAGALHAGRPRAAAPAPRPRC